MLGGLRSVTVDVKADNIAADNMTDSFDLPVPTHQWLMAVSDFIRTLDAPTAGQWLRSHAYRYGWFASKAPHYENCAYAKRTLELYASLEHPQCCQWLVQLGLDLGKLDLNGNTSPHE